MLPRRYQKTILKLLLVVPVLWLIVTLFISSDNVKSELNSHKVRDKHKDEQQQQKPVAQARVDLLHNSNRLGEMFIN